MNVQMKQTVPCVDYKIKLSGSHRDHLCSLPSQIHENFHSNYNLKVQSLCLCLTSAEKRGILGHDRITGRRPAGQIGRPLPASSPASAPCPPWARDASRLPPILVSPLLTPSHLPCHWLVLFSSLAPLALPGHMGMVTHLFVPGHSPPFLQSEGQKSLLPDRVNLSASFLLNGTHITSLSGCY